MPRPGVGPPTKAARRAPVPASSAAAPLPAPPPPAAAVTVHGGDGYSLCIECGQPATEGLYKEYSKDNIRLSRCENCGIVADRLIEYELILVGLDLALHRLPAWRHILFNRKPHAKLQWPQILRMAVVLVLIDTHIKYAVYVHYSSLAAVATQPPDHIDPTDTPTYQVALLLRILLLSFLEHVVFIGVVAAMVMWKLGVRRLSRPPIAAPSSSSSSSLSSSSSSLPAASSSSSSSLPAASSSSSSFSSSKSTSSFSFSSFVARKLVQGLLYPTFGRLVVVFVMVWDPAVVVANLISLLVLSSQWQALRTVVSAVVALGDDGGRKEGKRREGRRVEMDAAALPFVAGLLCKIMLRLAAFRMDASCSNLYLV